MEKSKLLELLKKMHSRELTRFGEFIHSPYHNKNESLKRLGDCILKEAPDFDNERRLAKERVFQHVFPDKPFDAAVFHRCSSQLLELLYAFLTLEQHQKQAAAERATLLEALRRRKVPKHYELLAKDWQDVLDKEAQQLGRAESDWLRYRFYREANAYFIDSGERRYDAHLQGQYQALNRFFLLEQWRMACDMASRNTVVQGKYSYPLLPYLSEYVEQSEHRDDIVLALYRRALDMLTQPAEAQEPHYQQLKTAVLAVRETLSDADLVDIYGYLLNYSIRQINRGKKEYYREALQHYEFLVGRRLMFFDGYLPAANYKNIVTIALALEEYEWAKQFIHEHRLSLPPDVRENAFSYNLASYYYAIGQHKEALQTLHDVVFTDVSYHLGAKIIQLKSYYELDEGEALYSLLDSFGSYLRRNKEISDAQKTANAHFLRLAKKLYQLKEGKNHWRKAEWLEKYEDWWAKMHETSPIANKLWLENAGEALRPT